MLVVVEGLIIDFEMLVGILSQADTLELPKACPEASKKLKAPASWPCLVGVVLSSDQQYECFLGEWRMGMRCSFPFRIPLLCLQIAKLSSVYEN